MNYAPAGWGHLGWRHDLGGPGAKGGQVVKYELRPSGSIHIFTTLTPWTEVGSVQQPDGLIEHRGKGHPGYVGEPQVGGGAIEAEEAKLDHDQQT